MKHLLSISLLLLVSPWLRAELVFESTRIELKAALGDEKAEAVFKFRNEGDEPVLIKRVKSSCGCTVPELAKDEYGPGESGEIRALFTFGSRSGKQQKRISVETNEGNGTGHTLLMVTQIPQWGRLQPQLLRWTLGQELSPREIRLEIEHPDQISISDTTTEMEHFLVEKAESSPGLEVFSVTPKATGARATERFEVTLSVGDSEETKTRQLAVYCLIR